MNRKERIEQIRSYIERLGKGEDLAAVQADFRKNFEHVSAQEIVMAEQELIAQGTPEHEIQRLCDVHSALFHGKTREERIAAAEEEVARSMDQTRVKGHPLHILHLENEKLDALLAQAQDQLDADNAKSLEQSLEALGQIGVHYDKKDQLLLPSLKRHGIAGPANVMWGVDDEVRKSLRDVENRLAREGMSDDLKEKIANLLRRMKEMIFKEEHILFPMVQREFSLEEWQKIHADMPRFGFAWLETIPAWEDAMPDTPGSDQDDGTIRMAGGSLTKEQLEGILRILPLELTFIDENNINQYFSENSELLPRPMSALGHSVFDCHPAQAQAMVERVIGQLKSGEKDRLSMRAVKRGKKAMVSYIAVRDAQGKYLGVLETVQDLSSFE